MKFFIANWKANKSLEESINWINTFQDTISADSKLIETIKNGTIKIIVCPPYLYLPHVNQITNKNYLSVGSQDLSTYNNGSFTGEITAQMIKPFCDFVIIGHSERRRLFNETEDFVSKKITLANENNIQTIQCIRGENDIIYPASSIIAYEPVGAIGTGKNEDPNIVLEKRKHFKLLPNQAFLYGGSISPENCFEYMKQDDISGLLIGSASLDPLTFYAILKAYIDNA